MMNKKRTLLLTVVIGIILSSTYLFFFFQKGIVFENSFLVLHEENDKSTYHGVAQKEPVTICVEPMPNEPKKITVSYSIGNGIQRNYSVTASPITPQETDVVVFQDETPLFHGTYRPSSDTPIVLWDKNEKPVLDNIRITQYENHPFDASYTVATDEIVTTALGDNISIRGNWFALFLAILILSLTIIDIKHPLLFFTLNHFLSVKNPEPSTLYLCIQKIQWCVFPLIAMGLLIASLVVH